MFSQSANLAELDQYPCSNEKNNDNDNDDNENDNDNDNDNDDDNDIIQNFGDLVPVFSGC